MSSKRRKKKNNEMINTENAAAEASMDTADEDELTPEPENIADIADDVPDYPETPKNAVDTSKPVEP